MRILLLAGLLLTGTVHAENCVIDLKGDDAMKFDKAEVTVSASCKTITITTSSDYFVTSAIYFPSSRASVNNARSLI